MSSGCNRHCSGTEDTAPPWPVSATAAGRGASSAGGDAAGRLAAALVRLVAARGATGLVEVAEPLERMERGAAAQVEAGPARTDEERHP